MLYSVIYHAPANATFSPTNPARFGLSGQPAPTAWDSGGG